MTHSRTNSYLESRVLTAPPHRLHLMLIEGALRFGRQAEQAMQAGDFAAASAPLMRTIEIVGEMLAGVRSAKSEINDKLAGFYWFLFRTVSSAKINDDVAKLGEVLRLLEYERETWQLVCDKFAAEAPTADAPARPALTPLPDGPHAAPIVAGSFSLEA